MLKEKLTRLSSCCIEGSYECSCNPGFEGDGRRCDSVSSCANVSCTQDAECVENGSEASCRCLPGFRGKPRQIFAWFGTKPRFPGDGYSCQPMPNQACDVSNNCSPYAICSVLPGREDYSCSCHPGFEGDGYQCVPVSVTSTEAPSELTTGKHIQTIPRISKSIHVPSLRMRTLRSCDFEGAALKGFAATVVVLFFFSNLFCFGFYAI